jgi:Flp pilus assembly CpaF family ATPase
MDFKAMSIAGLGLRHVGGESIRPPCGSLGPILTIRRFNHCEYALDDLLWICTLTENALVPIRKPSTRAKQS